MKRFLELLGLTALLCSCAGKLDGDDVRVEDIRDVSHDMMILGDKLEDPYTVENMSAAMASLYPVKAERVQLKPTDYYVRFLPGDESELDFLSSMGFELVDHPVDYHIVRDGDYYHDPQVPQDRITWQYALVREDFVFPPDIVWEKIDDCYLPEHDTATKSYDIDWDAVEMESYRLTGNSDLLNSATKGSSESRPSGRIAIVDPDLGPEPVGVRGVKVMCNTFVRFSTAYTDDNGCYEMKKSYSTELRYRIVFKNEKGFAIGFNNILLAASTSTLGKHGPEGVSVVLDTDADRKVYTRCAVNNAVRDYWDLCSRPDARMKTPPANLRIWLFQHLPAGCTAMMQQGCMVDGTLLGDFLGDCAWLAKMFLPDIMLGLNTCERYSDIYAMTMHECAHASHYMQVGNSWWRRLCSYVMKTFITSGFSIYGAGTEQDNDYCEIAEMWAYAFMNVQMRERYPEIGTVYGLSYWFSPQIFMYLDERGLTMNRILPALSADVTDMETLKSRLLSLYPEFKSMIMQAFSRYE